MTHQHSHDDTKSLYEAGRCVCCTAPMDGSDHCPYCGCETFEASDSQHAREYAMALYARMEKACEAMGTEMPSSFDMTYD